MSRAKVKARHPFRKALALTEPCEPIGCFYPFGTVHDVRAGHPADRKMLVEAWEAFEEYCGNPHWFPIRIEKELQ